MDFAQQPRHLLVVDDEQALARLVADYLTRDGFSVSLAFDGPAAVQAARDRAPHVVVLDLGLPGLDGIEVCRQLRTFTDCYVIMLTARTDEVDKLIGLSVGADDYLTKPFSPRELVARVQVMLRRPRVPAPAGGGAGGLTLWLVALAVGPVIFHDHLHRAAVTVPAQTSRHVEEAFQSASAISISVAVLASLGAALGVSAYVTRRIAGPVVRLAAAARDVAAGHYAVRMAARLETVEATRRRLLADLAHEIRTPVATLDAYLEGLEDGVVTVDADTVAVLRGQTARLTRLTEDITAVSRADEHQLDLHPHPVAAGQLIGAAVAVAADRYQAKGVRLSAEVAAGLPPVTVDPDRIAQVLGNLLDNALRHTPAGGRVSVAAARAEGGIVITVADTGEGIAA